MGFSAISPISSKYSASNLQNIMKQGFGFGKIAASRNLSEVEPIRAIIGNIEQNSIDKNDIDYEKVRDFEKANKFEKYFYKPADFSEKIDFTNQKENVAEETKANNDEKSKETSEKENTNPEDKAINGKELTDEQKKSVKELKRIDQEVRTHEQAHIAAGGGLVRGGASYSYQKGADGRNYATGGEVNIDTSAEGDPAKTAQKMQQVIAAAMAPAEPSSQDYSVAASARKTLFESKRAESQEKIEEQKVKAEEIDEEKSEKVEENNTKVETENTEVDNSSKTNNFENKNTKAENSINQNNSNNKNNPEVRISSKNRIFSEVAQLKIYANQQNNSENQNIGRITNFVA
jgi:hypothetical protein